MTNTSRWPPQIPTALFAGFIGLIALIGLTASLSARAATATGEALPDAIAQLLDKHRIPTSAVSLVVREMDGKSPLLRINGGVARNPASAIKLLTTLAALELLGPGHQWQTTYLADGVIQDGVLGGDLVLQGGGDPFLTVERLLGHVLMLRQRGLETITGQLLIDNSRFAPPPHDPSAFDGKPRRLYNVGPDAALANFSATQLIIEPRESLGNGGRNEIHVRLQPPLAGLSVVGKIQARDGKCISPDAGWSYRLGGDGENLTMVVGGAYRTRCGTHSISRSFFANTDYTYRLFTALWRAMGGKLDGGYRVAIAPGNAQPLLTVPSVPLADIITGINKFSNNVMSRQLLLTLGAELAAAPGSVPGGVGVIKTWLAANGLALPALVMENGSGLSRKSRLSADGLWALLKRGWDGIYRPEFLSSLPLAAVDGTLRARLQHSPLRARARIKTGLMDGVRSMAGYVHARNNRHYGVAMMIDSSRVNFWNGNALQDALLEWVYRRRE